MNTPNNHRIIKLYRTNGGADTEQATWRYNLINMYNSAVQSKYFDNKEDFFIDFDKNKLESTLVVDSNIMLLMENDIPGFGSKGTQSYGSPILDVFNDSGINKKTRIAYEAANIIGNNTSGITWMPWFENIPSWTGSQGGVTIQYEFKFAMGQYGLWNAKEEVVKPILNLIAPTLPKYIGEYQMIGPYPTTMGLIAKIGSELKEEVSKANKENGTTTAGTTVNLLKGFADKLVGYGENIVDTYKNTEGSMVDKLAAAGGEALQSGADVTKGSLDALGGFISGILENTYKPYTYNIQFGNMQEFKQMLIKDSDVTFSNQVDQFGYPVAGTATLTMTGVVPPALSFDKGDRTSIKFGMKL